MSDLERFALKALVAAGHVEQSKVDEAIAIGAAIRNAQGGQQQGAPSVQTSPTVPRDALDALASAWIEQAGLHEQNALEADSIGGMKMSVAINEARMSERLSAALALKSVLSSYQLMAAGWSGWATQYPGKMPVLRGAREIAELNHCPEEGQRLLFLSEQPAQAVDLGRGIQAIAAERERQLTAEGFSRESDQQYQRGELAKAATAYVQLAAMDLEAGTRDHIAWHGPAAVWPWPPEWWRPVDARRDLVRAGALIAAQIDLIDSAKAVQS